jgi:iron complex transport system substrate-binding protein
MIALAVLLAPALVAAAAPPTAGAHAAGQPTERIVSIGGSVTETVFALGHGARVVAVDGSSVVPTEATRLPQVGYHRAFSAEGVLAQRPTLVLIAGDAGPPAAVAAVRRSGVRVHVFDDVRDLQGARARIEAVAAALGAPDGGAALVKALDDDLAALPPPPPAPPRVLFLYGRGNGAVSVAGRNTSADAMIALAGGKNAVAFEGYLPLSGEGALTAQPDVLLVPARGLTASGGVDGILALPGLADTPAGRARRVVAVEDLALLGFGPRTGEGVAAIRRGLLEAAPPASGPPRTAR